MTASDIVGLQKRSTCEDTQTELYPTVQT